jgi:hypothetical protein
MILWEGEMLRNMALVLLTPKALPPLAWGPPGVGKSSRVYKLAQAFNAALEVVIASLREPTDFFGLNIPVDGNGLKVEPPGWAVRMKKALDSGKKALVFHDEISCAAPAVQAALLRVILEGAVGELSLAGAMQVAVANPPDQAAGGWDLALPLANRFTHLRWPAPSGKEWTSWLLGETTEDDDIAALIARFDLKEWERCFERSKSLFSGFIKRFPEALNEDPAKIAGRFPAAYSTPRSMENAVRLYATCLHLDPSRASVLLEGSIGEPNAIKFLSWVRDADLPDPEDLLADPSKWKPDLNRDDKTFAVLGSVSAAAVDKKFKDKQYLARWVAAWKVVDRTISASGGKDLVVISCRKLAAKENRPKDGLRDQGVRDTVLKLQDVIGASGLMNE